MKGKQRRKREQGVRYSKKGTDAESVLTTIILGQARSHNLPVRKHGVSLTLEKVSMEIHTIPPLCLPQKSLQLNTNAKFHSFIYLSLHSFTQ